METERVVSLRTPGAADRIRELRAAIETELAAAQSEIRQQIGATRAMCAHAYDSYPLTAGVREEMRQTAEYLGGVLDRLGALESRK